MNRRNLLSLVSLGLPLLPSSLKKDDFKINPSLSKDVKTEICDFDYTYELVFDSIELSDVINEYSLINTKLLREKVKEQTLKQIPFYLFGNYLTELTNNIALELSQSMPLQKYAFSVNIPKNYLVDSMDLSIEVNKNDFSLKLLQNYNNKIITLLESKVAIGRGENGGKFKTPEGNFFLQRFILDPWWYPPAWAGTDRPSPPGPNNPYGLYMAEITTVNSKGDYEFSIKGDTGTRLHGTNKPWSIGTASSHGCVRVGEVEELFKGMFNYVKTLEGKTTSRGTIYPLINPIPVKIHKN